MKYHALPPWLPTSFFSPHTRDAMRLALHQHLITAPSALSERRSGQRAAASDAQCGA